MNIARYYASIGFQVSNKDIQKVDRALNSTEAKLRAFQARLNKTLNIRVGAFSVDQKRLNLALGNALDVASTRTTFEVSRFAVDQSHLNRVMTSALMQASQVASNRVQIRPNINPANMRGSATPTTHAGVPHSRRERTRAYAGVGGIGLGLMGPLGYGTLALAGGGYGLGALNRRNQEVVSAQLQAQAVVQQAGGTVEQGQASFQYLRSEANRIGFNYLDASADYNKLISGLTGSGFSVRDSQKVFSGFAELARVNKLDKITQNRLFRALSQVAGKGKLQADELTSQISEALPGGTALFARAYQAQLAAQGKGGGLTGQAAIEKLRSDMQKGIVTSDILRYAGLDASLQANKGGALDLAKTASQAEQQRYQNAVSDLAVLASTSGVEEGFARIFRTLNAGLGESNGLVTGLAEGFNEATKWADDLLLFPQSFVRALEGKDSLVADWLGVDTTRQLVQDFKDIKEIWAQITAIKAEDIFGDFLPTLQSTSRELASILSGIAEFKKWKDGMLPTTKIEGDQIERIDPFNTGTSYPSPLGIAQAVGNNFLVNLQASRDKSQAINDPQSIYYNDPLGYDQMEMDRRQYSEDRQRVDLSKYAPQSKEELDDFNNQQKLAAMEDASIVRQSTVNNEISLILNIDPITLGQMDIQAQADQLMSTIALKMQETAVFFPQKE